MKNVVLLVLAGGESSRFWPLPHKLLLLFFGVSLLEHQIELYEKAGFGEIVLVASKAITERFNGLVVKTVLQEGKGQGAAILSARELLRDKSVLIINANDIVDDSLFRMSTKLIEKNVHNFIIGMRTKKYFPGGYLVLDGKKVVEVQEKPREGEEPSKLIKPVFDYFKNANTLLDALDEVKADPVSHYEETLSHLMKKGEIFEMHEYDQRWIPLKYPWHALDVMDDYLNGIKKSNISSQAFVHKTASITGSVVVEKGVRIMEFAKIVGPTYIGTGAIIGNHTLIRNSMIGENTVVGFGSEITRSYVGSDCWFHTNYVGDSVIADHVGMGAGAVTANLRLDEREVRSSIRQEWVNTQRVKLGAIVGAGARIGIEAQLMPGVKVGKSSVVGPGVRLTRDLEDHKRCIVEQNHIIEDAVDTLPQDRARFRKKLS